jgi:hypothetical protein
VVFGIVSENRFQEYLSIVIPMAIGANRFRWVNATHPWCLDALVRPRKKLDEELRGDADVIKGIFLLPHEIAEETWKTYMDMQAFSRTFGGNSLLHKSMAKLKPRAWLNDEVINSYLSLLPQNCARGIKVTNTFVFQALQSDRPQNYKENLIRSMVMFIFSLILLLAQL